MSVLLFANNAFSTLDGAINSSVTSLTVAPGTGSRFPAIGAGQYFVATLVDAATGLINEIVQVTAISGDVMTIVRGQEGTTPQSWLTGDLLNNFWTAGSAAAMLQQAQFQQQACNFAVDTGTADNVVIALSPTPGTLASIIGAPIRVKIAYGNLTTTPTLTITGCGTAQIYTFNASGAVAVSVGALAPQQIVELYYDGTKFQYLRPAS